MACPSRNYHSLETQNKNRLAAPFKNWQCPPDSASHPSFPPTAPPLPCPLDIDQSSFQSLLLISYSAQDCQPPAYQAFLAFMDSSDTKDKLKNSEMFRKRSKTVFHKADQLASKCGARVYCLLQRDNKFYQYTSSVEPAWPPSKEDMVNSQHLIESQS